MDNSTAEVFVNDTAYKTKLKHIDVRQKWVQTLRDKKILRPVHVDTKDNLADLFTKILGKQDFTRLRSMVMKPKKTSIWGGDLKFAWLLCALAHGTFQAAAPPPSLHGELRSRHWPVHTSRLFLFS